MSHYIFLSDEGYTFEPFSNSYLPEMENMQVIGIASGETEEEAFGVLLEENPHIITSEFNKVIGYKLDNNYAKSIRLHYLHTYR